MKPIRFFTKILEDKEIMFIFAPVTNIQSSMSTQAMTKKIAKYFETQPVLKAWLFGSYARGEETPDSDVDLLVEYDNNARISLLTISHMMGELEGQIGRKVDLIEHDRLMPFAMESANRDKYLIYERRS
jgi:predicted nucleotidyltransferase